MTIDFEQDQQNTIQKTDGIQSLADQVERLEGLQKRLELQEDNIKSTLNQIYDPRYRGKFSFYLRRAHFVHKFLNGFNFIKLIYSIL